MKYDIKKLSFGKTWGEALNLYLDNFLPLFIIALISALPFIMISPPPQAEGTDIPLDITLLNLFTLFIVQMGIASVSAALLIEFISKRYLKQHQTLKQYIQNVLNYILPIIGLAIIQSVIVGLGFMALFIPGIYLALALSLAVEILIIERKGIIDSLKRSFLLTHGKKLEIFLFTLVLALISLVLEKILDLIFSVVDQAQMAVDIDSISLLLTQALLAPLGACLFILIYFNIRIEKEGFDPEHMMNQSSSDSDLQNKTLHSG